MQDVGEDEMWILLHITAGGEGMARGRRRRDLGRRHQGMGVMQGAARSCPVAWTGIYCVGEGEGEPAVASHSLEPMFQNTDSQNL